MLSLNGHLSSITRVAAFFMLQDAKGNDVDLGGYKGKVLLIVNVASEWYVDS